MNQGAEVEKVTVFVFRGASRLRQDKSDWL